MSVEMQDIVEEGIKRLEGISYEQLACEIAADLTAAGYGKLDVFSLAMMDQLRHGVGSLVNSLGDIIRGTELLSVEREKCEAILRVIDHAKEREERPVNTRKTGGLPKKITANEGGADPAEASGRIPSALSLRTIRLRRSPKVETGFGPSHRKAVPDDDQNEKMQKKLNVCKASRKRSAESFLAI